MAKPEWDSHLRRRNLEYKTGREIPPEEFARKTWYNVTSYSTLDDAHEWVETPFWKNTVQERQ